MKRVGIVGGGQLAWMMATAAKKLEIELIVQTPQITDPAASIAQDVVLAPVGDATATAKLAQKSDLITFENEFVDLPALMQLAEQGVCFYPHLDSLSPLLDKFDQRRFLQTHQIPTPKFEAIDHLTAERLTHFGLPAVLKARRHGYDGQGTFILKTDSDLPATPAPNHWLLEEFIPFTAELAVMAARSIDGEIVIYPTVETQQENQVCQRVFVTGAFGAEITAQVESIARTILQALDYIGVLGIEFFLTPEGKVLVNELAPRTHNSGHYSLNACVTSQFEQQLRAICGLPLGRPDLTSTGAVMVNLLGYETSNSDYTDKRQQLAQFPQAHLYWYGKTSRPGRKLGHVTVLLSETQLSEAAEIAGAIERIWYGADF